MDMNIGKNNGNKESKLRYNFHNSCFKKEPTINSLFKLIYQSATILEFYLTFLLLMKFPKLIKV